MPKYEIIHGEAFPLIRYNMEAGEVLKAESDAMVAMSPNIDVTGKAEGGILKGLTRKLAGESFFLQQLEAARGPGEVLLAHASPGGIMDIVLDGSYGLLVQKNGFLAATQGVEVSTKMQSLGKGLFSGEGFFIVNITGKGVCFVSSYGAIHVIDVGPGEQVIIDNGHLVAWPDTMTYAIEKASKGWISSFKSGENLVCRFTGPGKVLIQTRNPGGFVGWLTKLGIMK
jgi:uncharacterized protein (TIGR00266 family)